MSLAQLSNLLPLPEEELKQILDYASTLSKQHAVIHFNSILGESPQALEFVSSFNSRRKDPAAAPEQSQSTSSPGVPKPTRAPKKKKPPLHALPARPVQNTYESQGRVYKKDDENDFIARAPTSTAPVQARPDAIQHLAPKAPPSAAGPLISDLKVNPKSAPVSRTSSPDPKSTKSTKIYITGGTPMQGASTALNALDSAIRSLEIATNPTRQSNESRACNCIATRHPLLAAAPNCLNCGKVICVKEGLGPCTFCGTPLLSSDQIQGMIRSLKEERGRERMAMDASAHRRAEVSRVPAPFSNPRAGGPTPSEIGMSAAEIKAKEHRDKLLGFQAQNAKRTTVKDEASDFETPDAGTNMWASMEERAAQLKRQQKVLREQEWNARPEYEKRREVVSIDLKGRRIVRRLENREMPRDEDEEQQGVSEPVPLAETSGNGASGKGTFSRNPLLGGLIKPVYKVGKGKEVDTGEDRKKTWRRVQDNYDDESNEKIILDGGVYGGDAEINRVRDEPYR